MGRDAADEGDDYVESRSFEWQQVPEEAPASDPRRRRRVRALIAVCVAGAVAIIAITVVLVTVAVHEVNDRNDHPRCHYLARGATEPCTLPTAVTS